MLANPSKNPSRDDFNGRIPSWIVSASFVVSVVLIGVIVVLVTIIEYPSVMQFNVYRTVLALAGASFGMSLGGFFTMRIHLRGGGIITAGGTLLIFLFLYLFPPNIGMLNPRQELLIVRTEFEHLYQDAILACDDADAILSKARITSNEIMEQVRKAVDLCQLEAGKLERTGAKLIRWGRANDPGYDRNPDSQRFIELVSHITQIKKNFAEMEKLHSGNLSSNLIDSEVANTEERARSVGNVETEKSENSIISIGIRPSISVSPARGSIGTNFSQTGRGFTPGRVVAVHLRRPDGSELPILEKLTTIDGAYSLNLTTLLGRVPGKWASWAVDNATSVSSNSTLIEIIWPTIDVSHLFGALDGGQHASYWSLSGTYFSPRGLVTFHFRRPDKREESTLPKFADENGSVTDRSVEINRTFPGIWSFWAIDGLTGITSATVTSTVN